MNAGAVLAPLALLATAWIVCAGLLALLCQRLWPLLARRSRAASPRVRARRFEMLAILPAVLPTVLLGLCVAPGVLGVVSGAGDHCPAHLDHPHLCLFHESTPLAPAPALGLGVFLVVVVATTRHGLRWLIVAGRDDRRLRGVATGQLIDGAHVAHSRTPFALTIGWVQPRIWLSTALDETLTPRQRAIVLAHEGAHAERRDPLRWALVSTLARVQLPATRRPLLAALRLACEQDCDERAAGRVGDRLGVAETLLYVERRVQGLAPTPAHPLEIHAGLIGSTLPARVESLLAGEPPASRDLPLLPVCLASVLLGATGAEALHHAAEHLLESVLRWISMAV